MQDAMGDIDERAAYCTALCTAAQRSMKNEMALLELPSFLPPCLVCAAAPGRSAASSRASASAAVIHGKAKAKAS